MNTYVGKLMSNIKGLEEIEPDHDGTSLWIPRSQEHKGFAVCHIDKFLSELDHCDHVPTRATAKYCKPCKDGFNEDDDGHDKG